MQTDTGERHRTDMLGCLLDVHVTRPRDTPMLPAAAHRGS